MFHIDGTPCSGKGCAAVWCTATEPMTPAEIKAEMVRVAREQGWVR